ncbi:MAG: FG-GAP-like repeat-containing protein [Candidatus Heimdallarchaeota archaeon]
MKQISFKHTRYLLLLLFCFYSVCLFWSPFVCLPENEPAFIEISDIHSSPELSPQALVNLQNGDLDLLIASPRRNQHLSSNISELPKPPKERINFSTESHPTVYKINTDPTESIESLAVADFNQDGIDDIVAGSWDETVYFLDGATGQTVYTNTEPFWIIEVLAVADFNQDGIPDIAAGADQIYFIDGATGETLRTNIEIEAVLFDIALADFNQDGMPDIVVGGNDRIVYFVDGATGETLYKNTDPEDVVSALNVADFTQDGIPDVVAGSWDKTIYAIDGASGATLWTNAEPTSFVEALGVEDFNADGVPDVAAGSDGVYFLDGTSGETLWHNTDTGEVYAIIMADFNDDGVSDVAAGAGDVYMIDGTSGKTFWRNTELTNVIESIYDLAVADFNNDGIPDIAAGAEGIIYLINGATGETFSRNTEPTALVNNLVAGDFNGDGISDVVAGSEDSNVYILISDHFTPVLQYCLLPWIPSSMVSLDFQVIYDEPNVNTIWMGYYSEEEVNIMTIDSSTANTVRFTVPPVKTTPLEFWFGANDTWGNQVSQGNETNRYQLDIPLQQLWTNTKLSFSVNTLAMADFTGDGGPDVVGADIIDVYFLNGATGETLYGTEDIKDTTWALTTADFNQDGISDVAAASDYIYFVDGATGETLLTSTEMMEIIWALDTADFNVDGIPDVAYGDFAGKIEVIDGASGDPLWTNTEPIFWIKTLDTADFNADSVPDVVVGSIDSNVYFIDGATGETLFNNTEPIIDVKILEAAEFNQDGIPDVVAGADAIYGINGKTGEILWVNNEPLGAVRALATADFNNDSITDVVAGTDAGKVYICNGATGESIFTIQVAGPIEEKQLVVGNVTKDQVPDIIIATVNPAMINVIDGRTGKARETFSLEFPPTSNLLLADFDQNGFLDIGIGHPNGQIAVIQPLSPMYDLFPSSEPLEVSINQGMTSNFLVNLRDAFERGVVNAEVSLLASKIGTEVFTTYVSTDLGNGSYSFSVSTADWRVGEWQLYLLASDSLYNELDISDYVDINEYYLPPSKSIRVIGEVLPDFILASEAGPFANTSQVVEGSNITLQIYLQDAFYHALSQEEASVLVSFMGPHVQARYEQGKFLTELSTKGLKHGIYEIGVSIWGPHLNKAQRVLIVEIIPRFPTMEFSSKLLLIVAGVAFLIMLFLMRGVKSIQTSLKTSPDAVLQTSRRMSYILALFLVATFGGGFILYNRSPILSFLIILVAFGEILILYFVWFFSAIYKRVTNFEEEVFSIKAWWSTVIFSGLVVFPIALSFLISSQIEWFDYYIKQELTNLMVITIPSLYWEIGIVSFGSGFVLVILNAIWRTKISIERLKEKKEEVEREYKEPNIKMESVLATEIAYTSNASFNYLLRSIFIWYGIVLFTFFISFQLFAYIRLAASVAIPAGSTLVIAVRNQIRDLVKRR